jgi:oligopeptide transport system ATP-binding protein
LYDGETLAIVGESGSGKTVLTKTFTGMLESNGRIHSGSILFEGKELTSIQTDKDWEKIRGAKIATVFQDPMTSLNPLKKIGIQITEVIEKHQKLPPDEAKRIALGLMDKVGIKEPNKRFNDYPFQYSGGMRQRIVIAIALACKPKILICDEPTTALDVTIQAQILELIKSLQKDYKFTTIYITHDLGVVANVADRVAVMYAGQIVEYGSVREIFYDPRHPYTWALLSSLPTLAEKGKPLFAIPGTPPTLFNQIAGDAFAPRNRFALNIDFEEEPPFFKVSDTHYAKTWLLDPRAPAAEPPEAILFMRKKASLHSERPAEAME